MTASSFQYAIATTLGDMDITPDEVDHSVDGNCSCEKVVCPHPTRTREAHINDLTDAQLQFPFHAEQVREKIKQDQMDDNSSSTGGGVGGKQTIAGNGPGQNKLTKSQLEQFTN